MAATSGPVLRRRVFYIAGFDPASPRKYHGIFTVESAKQAALTGARIEVGPLEERDELAWGWTVRAERAGQIVEIDYQCLRWNDVVRRLWPREGPAFFLGVWRAFFAYWRRGILALPARLVAITALAPVVVMTAFVLLYAAAIGGLCVLGADLARRVGWPWQAGAFVPLLLWLAVVPVWLRADKLIPVGWLGRGMICVAGAERALHVEIEERLEAFARRLVEAAGEPEWDEILLVGHSMGCQLAVRTLGQALRIDPGFGKTGAPVSLLTLGQLIPLYSLMTDDPTYRAEFKAAVAADWIDWIDVTGPSDPGSVCDVHPLTGLGFEPPARRPVRRNPRFHAVLTAQTYRKLRRAPLAFHFQYLMATEAAGGYDYFEMTTGPRRLSESAGTGHDIRTDRGARR